MDSKEFEKLVDKNLDKLFNRLVRKFLREFLGEISLIASIIFILALFAFLRFKMQWLGIALLALSISLVSRIIKAHRK
jgi:hypothetical protein